MQSHFENEPLLYIDQPELTKPKVQMQMEYFSTLEASEGEKQEGEKQRKLSKNESFHTLTVMEKVDYLITLPKDVMQVKCEVQTAKEKMVGTILKRENDIIEMYDQHHKTRNIPLKEIENIRLLGL